MSGRERLTSVYRGETADRIPWAPLIFDDTLSLYPSKVREAGPMEFTRMIGGDIVWRMNACRLVNDAVRMTKREDMTRIFLGYETKVGKLSEVRRKTRFGAARTKDYPLKAADDYRVLEHILEHQSVQPDYDHLIEVDEQIGRSGIVMIFQSTSPVQSLIQFWMGATRFCSHLLRHKHDLENLMELMHEKNQEIYGAIAESPIDVGCIVENTDINLVSPSTYEEYSIGHVKDFVDTMHRHDKIALVHMCGKINGLLKLIKRTGLDGIDCLTPHPTGDVEFRRAYEVLGDRFVIHGILDPTRWMSENRTVDEVQGSIHQLLDEVHGRPFILCTAADGIPGIPIERFKAIGRIMRKYSA